MLGVNVNVLNISVNFCFPYIHLFAAAHHPYTITHHNFYFWSGLFILAALAVSRLPHLSLLPFFFVATRFSALSLNAPRRRTRVVTAVGCSAETCAGGAALSELWLLKYSKAASKLLLVSLLPFDNFKLCQFLKLNNV